jgi:hypothetical protein
MNDLQKELQDLKAKVADLESRIAAEPVAKWQPEGGNFFIQSSGKVSEVVGGSDTPHKEFGVERPTRQQAERAEVEMRKFNRLLALRDELCGDEVVDWSNNATGFYLYISHYQNRWDWSSGKRYETITPYFTSKGLAQRACAMLNSGEVEL